MYPLFFGGERWTGEAQAQVDAVDSGYGVGGPVVRLAILPIDLLVHGESFDRGRYVGTAIFVLALAALFLRPGRLTLALAAGAAAYGVVWWYGSPQARFLLPALAVLAAVGGVGAARLVRAGGWKRASAAIVLAAAAAAWAVPSVALTRQLLPAAVGAESRAETLERLTGTYDAFRAVAARTDGTVAFAGYPSIFNYPERAIDLGRPEFGPDVPPGVYRERLRDHGVRFVLLAQGMGEREIAPIRGCLDRLAAFDARLVTSRSLDESIPLRLVLHSAGRCLGGH